MVNFWTAPRVFVSYTWHPEENKEKVLSIAEDLRSKGFDVRIDVYFQQSLYGFSPPQPVLGDPRNAWIVWAEDEIRRADCVLLLCTDQYTASDRNRLDYGRFLGQLERTAVRRKASNKSAIRVVGLALNV